MSVLTMQNVVKNVESRTVKEGTPEARMIYDVVDKDDVKWVVWEKPLAEKAFQLRGQPSVWQVDVSQKGTYTNRTLKGIDVTPVTGYGPAMDALAAQSVGTLDYSMNTPSISNGISTFDASVKPALVEEPSYKDRCIMRQAAGKVAAALGPVTADEFWSNCRDLANFFETGTLPGAQQGIESRVEVAETAQITNTDDLPF